MRTMVIALMVLGLPSCGERVPDGGGISRGDPIHLTDPAGDQVCADDPGAAAPAEMDILAVDIVEAAGGVEATITFNGDVGAYDAATTDQLPFSLQLRLKDDTYIEAFFSEKGKMKVSDGKAGVSSVFTGNTLVITLSGFGLDEIDKARASTFAYGYPVYKGACEDEAVHGTWP